MNDRDRLIELIADIQNDFEKWCVECAEDGHKDHQPLGEYLADKLLANGVIVQEWISVKDRLPTEEDAIEGGFVIANTEEKVIIALWSDVCRFNEFVTHWMPFPNPPKRKQNEF